LIGGEKPGKERNPFTIILFQHRPETSTKTRRKTRNPITLSLILVAMRIIA